MSRFVGARGKHWIPILIIVLMACLLSLAGKHGHDLGIGNPELLQAGILIIFTIGIWAFGVFPEPIGTLTFFLFAVLFGIGTHSAVFSGFQSPAWWLVLGGSITGIAIKTTGLGERMASTIFSRLGGHYAAYVAMVAILSLALAFVMPSTTGRILLLVPLVLTLAERIGFERGSNGRTGLIMTVAAASYMPATSILSANIPNAVLMGAADKLYGIELHYGEYLLLHFPVLGLLKIIALVWLVCRLYPEDNISLPHFNDASCSMSHAERMLSYILGGSLLLFATDAWHGISPAWVTLAAGIACMLPGLNVLTTKDVNERLAISPLLYVAGFLGLGAVMAESGLGSLIAFSLMALHDPQSESALGNVGFLICIYAAIGLLTTLPALPAILTPLAEELSRFVGLPIYTILMLQVPVFSTVFLPYQSPPMMIAMHLGGVGIWAGTKLCLALAGFAVLILLPVDYLWWSLLDLL